MIPRRLWYYLVLILVTCLCFRTISADENDEYVRQVLEEEQEHYGDVHQDDASADAYYEEQRKQQEEYLRQQELEEERLRKQEAERISSERERAFQAKLARMDADQQKKEMKKKKRDSKLVTTILKAAERGDHYKVLGISPRRFSFTIPSYNIQIYKFHFRTPGAQRSASTSSNDIKRAYRNRAMAVHPDKNRDGRAPLAFFAVEESAALLADPQTRQAYDLHRQQVAQARKERSKERVGMVVGSVQSVVGGFFKGVHKVLGPFAKPVLILTALVV